MDIMFNQPYYGTRETEYVNDALLMGTDYIEKAKRLLNGFYPNTELFLTSSATYALELVIANLFFQTGSEIILPSFNFPSAPNAVLRAGVMPIFADIDPETLTIDINDVERKISRHTASIIPVNYGGVSCDMEALMTLTEKTRIPVIEDASLSFGGTYKGRPLGTIGDFGILSFDSTKNISSEKGGMALINNATPDTLKTLTLFYNNGTDKQAFLDGKVPTYSWKQVGMNVAMSDLSAAVLAAQLEKAEEIQTRRDAVYAVYKDGLMDGQEKWGYRIPKVPKENKDNAHVFYIVFDSEETRERIRMDIVSQGIHAHTHYSPLHLSSMGRYLGYRKGDLPNTECVASRMLRLPLHAKMTPADAERVIFHVIAALKKGS